LANHADPLDATNRRISITVRFQKSAGNPLARPIQLPAGGSAKAVKP
jgi:hypothetical protein